MPVLNSKTIYNEEIKVWKEQLDQDYLSVRAVQIPNGATFYSNIMIMNESPAITMTIFLDKDDALEFAGDIMHVLENNGDEIIKTYTSTLEKGIKVEYHIKVSCPEGLFFRMDTTLDEDRFGDDSDTIMFIPSLEVAKAFAEAIVQSSYQSSDILQANKNLDEQMKQLKLDMKHNKVKELHFDVLDDMPKIYSEDNQFARIYEITPYNYEGNPTGYSFYRIMHLTHVPQVDFRDHDPEFLSCPFVYSDKMIEMGKEFLKRKHDELHDYVDAKQAKHEAKMKESEMKR